MAADESTISTEGVTVETIRAGDGRLFPKTGQTVTVHYVGKLPDGTIFDTTYKRGRPLKFKLNCEQVIRGWDGGVSQLSLGEMATIRMTAEAAWGKTGIPGLIPPNVDLEFEVELIGVQ